MFLQNNIEIQNSSERVYPVNLQFKRLWKDFKNLMGQLFWDSGTVLSSE